MMLSFIHSFNEGIQAGIRVGSTVIKCFILFQNGLKQGCTMAPTLFNLSFNAVVTRWRSQCEEVGIPILYKHSRKLVRN